MIDKILSMFARNGLTPAGEWPVQVQINISHPDKTNDVDPASSSSQELEASSCSSVTPAGEQPIAEAVRPTGAAQGAVGGADKSLGDQEPEAVCREATQIEDDYELLR